MLLQECLYLGTKEQKPPPHHIPLFLLWDKSLYHGQHFNGNVSRWQDMGFSYPLLCLFEQPQATRESSSATRNLTLHTHTPRGACQCTFHSYSPVVKTFCDDPQNTLLRSMQHAHAQWGPRAGMSQDSFHRQLSAPSPLWYMSSDWLIEQNVLFALKLSYSFNKYQICLESQGVPKSVRGLTVHGH